MACRLAAIGWFCRAWRPARAMVIEGPATASRAAVITSLSPAATSQAQITEVRRRSPDPSGHGSDHWGEQRRRARWRESFRSSPNRP